MPSSKKTSSRSGSRPFLAQSDRFWHASLPRDLRRAVEEGDVASLWTALGAHFRQRDGIQRFGEDVHALTMAGHPRSIEAVHLWWRASGPRLESEGADESSASKRLAESLQSREEILSRWQDHGEKEWLVTLAHVRALPLFVPKVAPEIWFDFLETLLATIEDAAGLSLGEHPLGRTLLVGEMGWTLGCLFPEIIPCRKVQAAGREDMQWVFEELLDGAGLPHAEDYPLLRPLVASWTRCQQLGAWIGKRPWRKKSQVQYEWAVNHLMRFSRPEGLPVFGPIVPGPGDFQPRTAELLEEALSFTTDASDRAIASVTCPWLRRKGKKASELELPEVTYHSEWSALASLRSGWNPNEPGLSVSYYPMRDPHGELNPSISVRSEEASTDRSVLAELRTLSRTLLSGPWEVTVARNGRILSPVTHWEETCWESDEDVDYLELELVLEEDVRVQRHFLLAHDDEFVLMADAVLAHESPPVESRRGDTPLLEYSSRFPLTDQVDCSSDADATEIELIGDGKTIARVLPLALSEWKVPEGLPGTLEAREHHLVLSQRSDAEALFAPLFFDVKKKRMKKNYTWRHLTVAENLEIVEAHQAVGYRVQSHRDQWLIYRSLLKPENRTLLGQNLVSELLVGQFDENGEIEVLLQIE